MTRIAIVEDDAAVREQLAGYVQRYTRQYLAVPVDGGMRRLDAAAIYYIESEGA